MKSILLAAILAMPLVQTGTPAYVGTWTAEQGGRTFVRLQLTTANTAIAGAMSLGDVEFDGAGAVRRAESAPVAMTPIQDVRVSGSAVTFSRKEGDDLDHFRLNVLADGAAELVLLISDEDRAELADEGIPLPKPIKLTKAK